MRQDAAPKGPGRAFLVFAGGVAFAQLGGWARRMLVGWQVWEITHAPFWVGLVGFCDLVPTLVTGPFAGAVIDRIPLGIVLRRAQAVNILLALGLAAATAVGAFMPLFLLLATIGFALTSAFEAPATNASVRSIVSGAALQRAISLMSIIMNASLFVAPLLAMPVIRHGAPAVGYAATSLGYLIFILCLIAIDIPARAGKPASAGVLKDIRAGYAYIAGSAKLRMLFISFFVLSIGGRSVTYLMPAIAAGLTGAGVDTLSFMLSTMAAGALAGAAFMGLRATAEGSQAYIVGSHGLAAICLAVIFGAPDVRLAVAAAFGLGIALALNSITSQTTIQAFAAPGMEGRVMSLYAMIFRGGPALGSLGAGVLSIPLGLPAAGLCFAALVGTQALLLRLRWAAKALGNDGAG